jgi:hypothetical protein
MAANWLRKLLKNLVSPEPRRRNPRRSRPVPLRLEVLEDRWLPSLVTLASFANTVGLTLSSNLVADSSGNLFGTASGGALGYGVVFEVAKGSGTITTFASFDSGLNLEAGLIQDGAGNLFGTTSSLVDGFGTVFELPLSPPTVASSSVSLPANATSLTICGYGFDTNTAKDSVSFDNGVTGNVLSARSTSLTVSVSGVSG